MQRGSSINSRPVHRTLILWLALLGFSVGEPVQAIVSSQATDTLIEKRVFSRNGRLTVEMESPQRWIHIDRSTGIPVWYVRRKSAGESAGDDSLVVATQVEAAESALRFLRQWKVQLNHLWKLESTRLIDHGSAGKEYLFIWTKRINSVFLPSSCSVGVNASTGEVDVYGLSDESVVIPLRWRLSAQDAISAVARSRRWPRWQLEDIRLHVGHTSQKWDEKNRTMQNVNQKLLWRVKLWGPQGKTREEDATAFADVEVDAVTGEVPVVYRYAGLPKRPGKKIVERAKKLLREQPDPKRSNKIDAPQTIFDLAPSANSSKSTDNRRASRI